MVSTVTMHQTQDVRIIRVDQRKATILHDFQNECFYISKFFDRFDFLQAKMIFADIGNRSYIALIESEPGSQDAAASSFDDRKVNSRIFQNQLRGPRPRKVAR